MLPPRTFNGCRRLFLEQRRRTDFCKSLVAQTPIRKCGYVAGKHVIGPSLPVRHRVADFKKDTPLLTYKPPETRHIPAHGCVQPTVKRPSCVCRWRKQKQTVSFTTFCLFGVQSAKIVLLEVCFLCWMEVCAADSRLPPSLPLSRDSTCLHRFRTLTPEPQTQSWTLMVHFVSFHTSQSSLNAICAQSKAQNQEHVWM